MLFIILECFLQSFSHACLTPPPHHCFDLAIVAVIIANINSLFLAWKGHKFVAALAKDVDHHFNEIDEHHGFIAAEIINVPIAVAVTGDQQKSIDHVVNIIKIADLFATAENFYFFSFKKLPDEHAHKALAVVFHQLARAVCIG